MGSVELAVRRDGVFERLFAVKRLHAQHASDPAVRQMFLDEARIAGMLRHQNVVHVSDVGYDESGPYLVMEYVEGVSLADMVKEHRADGRQIPLSVALDIGRQVARGLQAAHELVGADGQPMKLVHRDVSPQNALIGFDGCARLTDFGIAKAAIRVTKTETGVLKGKYGYMSPEALRFEEATQRSDLFSLGIVLFELISGERLFNESGMAAARRILNEDARPLADVRTDVPPSVSALVDALLAREPDRRPQSARKVGDTLRDAARELDGPAVGEYMVSLYGELRESRRARVRQILASIDTGTHRRAITARPSETPTVGLRPSRKSRQPRGLLLAFALLVAAVVAGIAGMMRLPTSHAPPRTPATPATSHRRAVPVTSPESIPDASISVTPTEPTRMRRRARMLERDQRRPWVMEW